MKRYDIKLYICITLLNLIGCPSKVEKVSVFNDCKPQEMRVVTEDDFIKDWFTLPVTKGEKGFNPVFIPFAYKSVGAEPDSNQPLTFPTLLSFKFDFVPDNYTARHPAFVFARDYAARGVKITDPDTEIAAYIEAWSASHAVGGELVQGKYGYTGTMIVFDRSGKEVLRKKYSDPVPYFTLMGIMVRDWMDHAGWPVSKLLWKELTRPMTSDMETVKMYGGVFSVAHRSHEEWAIYEDILRKDPNFAEVRFWYANQRAWQTSGEAEKRLGYAQALESHLVIPALEQFPYSEMRDSIHDEIFLHQLAYAQRVYPDWHASVLNTYLETYGETLSITKLEKITEYAKIYQCSYWFLSELMYQYYSRNLLDKAIPLGLSAINSTFLTGTGGYGWVKGHLGNYYTMLGYLMEGQELCRSSFVDLAREEVDWEYLYLAENLREQFRFAEAAELYRKAYLELKSEWVLCAAYMCLYEAGDVQTAEKWMKDRKLKVDNRDVDHIINARQSAVEGDLMHASELMKELPFERVNGEVDARIQYEAEIVKADLYLLSGIKSKVHEPTLKAYFINPRSQRVAHLMDLHASVGLLGKYYTIAHFIFPEQVHIKERLDALREKGYRDDPDLEITAMCEGGMNAYENFPRDKQTFWWTAEPHVLEYICLRMAKMQEKELRDKGLNMYVSYHRDWEGIFDRHTAHTRTFLLKVIKLLPEEEQAHWLTALENKRMTWGEAVNSPSTIR